MKLYNTLSRQSEEFAPIRENQVKLYTCGLTVYSQPHIGNWVSYIYWDLLVRVLLACGYEVIRVQNITDVGHLTSDEDAGEDKMVKGAIKEGLTAWQVAEKYTAIAEHEAYTMLGLIRPNSLPRATEYIPQQIELVKELESRGYTYIAKDGVYFDTDKLDDYGKLARLDVAGLEFGVRVADTGKKNPTDFAVWKFSNPNEKRDMEWDSPWGLGFPGWHLECSAMIKQILGDQIDIHTGGIDHIPVHHTNEIAQSEAVTGKSLANFWVHANHIKVDGKKMSKSLGNIYTLQDILDKGYSLEAFKLMILSKHYRTEGNFTWDILEAAQNRLNNWRAAIDLIWQGDLAKSSPAGDPIVLEKIIASLKDDLDSVGALAVIDDYFNQAANLVFCPPCLKNIAEDINRLFGINLLAGKTDITNEQKAIIVERELARNNKDWAKSDQLRDQLRDQGINISDTARGTLWSRI